MHIEHIRIFFNICIHLHSLLISSVDLKQAVIKIHLKIINKSKRIKKEILKWERRESLPKVINSGNLLEWSKEFRSVLLVVEQKRKMGELISIHCSVIESMPLG